VCFVHHWIFQVCLIRVGTKLSRKVAFILDQMGQSPYCNCTIYVPDRLIRF